MRSLRRARRIAWFDLFVLGERVTEEDLRELAEMGIRLEMLDEIVRRFDVNLDVSPEKRLT